MSPPTFQKCSRLLSITLALVATCSSVSAVQADPSTAGKVRCSAKTQGKPAEPADDQPKVDAETKKCPRAAD
jgi:hypothetical protein